MDLKPSEICYSQDTISRVFRKGGLHSNQLIGITLDDLCEGRISTYSIPKITVINRDGKYFSVDNRRLWIFRHMERLGKCTTINVIISYKIRLNAFKFTTKNRGISIGVRGNPGGTWYSKPDASRSRSSTNLQPVIAQQYALGSITQKSEFFGTSNHRRPASSPVYGGNVAQNTVHSGQTNRLGFQSRSSQRAQPPITTSQCDTSVLDSKILVAAIDFGTTNSGYAFSCRSDFENDPMAIVTNQWTTGDGRSVPFKAPTCVLFDKFQRFDSFGFKAEETYSNLVTENQYSNWYFFKNFKMELYENKDLNNGTKIKDTNGKQMLAITVVSECIKSLMTSLLETCNQASQIILPTDIHWVLTVPAIWNDGAKHFMREAAIIAGIVSDSLTLALEPEAASMFCKHVRVEDDSDEEEVAATANASKRALCPGSKYVILDAGDGTVDITVHEVQWNGRIKEIHKANGGPWGGTNVDEAFVRFLENIFGKRVVADFRGHNNGDYLELMREFEMKKTQIDPEIRVDIKLNMPASLYESYAIINKTVFSCSDFMKQVFQMKIVRDKLVVSSQQFVEMFRPTCDKIVSHLQYQFIQPSMKRINTIVMVGGFSDMRCVQRALGRAFPEKTLVIPDDPGMAVVKGAVIFGHSPKAIASRIVRYTYGVATASSFIEGVSKESKRFRMNGKDMCNDIFDIHARVGQTVTVDEHLMEREYIPLYGCLPSLCLPIYSSQKLNPAYTDEIGCSFIGNVNIAFDDPYARRETNTVKVRFIYGNTELGVEANIVKTNKIVKASFDCLG